MKLEATSYVVKEHVAKNWVLLQTMLKKLQKNTTLKK